MDVRNCKQCGRLFNYIGKPICPECLKVREDEFMKVKDFIRQNQGAGIAEVSNGTGVSVQQIRQWIREERLVLTSVSADSGVNCEGCGRPITTGRLCQNCKNQMSQDLNQVMSSTRVKMQAEDVVSPKKSGDKMFFLKKDGK